MNVRLFLIVQLDLLGALMVLAEENHQTVMNLHAHSIFLLNVKTVSVEYLVFTVIKKMGVLFINL